MVIFTDTGSVTANFVLIILQQQVTPLPQVCLDFATASTENQTPTGAHRPQLSHFLTHQTPAPLPPLHLFLSSGSALQVDMGSVGTLVVRGAQRKCPPHLPCPTNIHRFGCLGSFPAFGITRCFSQTEISY